ncbi:MAG: S9 family peptidase [Chloroflexi bacterium]|nr:S9 family peptidase [Chloroflexota bacterium]
MYRLDQFLSARSAFGPRFSQDGTRLFFLSDLTGAPGLWSVRLDAEGRWPEPVGVSFDRVTGAWPGPGSERLVVAADVGGNERTQLSLIERPGVTPRLLTHMPDAIHQFGGWHPNGRQIAYASNERNARFFDAYLLDVETGERRHVFPGEGQEEGAYYACGVSPDGARLLLQEAGSAWEHAVYVLELASGVARRLTAGHTPAAPTPARYRQLAWGADSRTAYCVTDQGRDFLGLAALDTDTGSLRWLACPDWDIDDVAVAPDGSKIAYQINVDGYSEVWVHEMATGQETAIPIPTGQAYEPYKWLPTFSWSPDGRQLAFTFSAADRPASLYVATPETVQTDGAPRRVTDTWAGGLDLDRLAPAELVHYPTFDGREIPAFVYRPHEHTADGTAPALFYMHGGPESQIRTMYNGVIQYFVHRGFVVVAPNVRGSLGYGTPYVHLDDVALRPDSVRDLAEAARWAARAGLAHPRRLAVMGASYGGYMVLAALTENPELWAAGVDIVGIANFVTFLENTGPWRRHHREVEYGSLAHDRAVLEAISPIHKADRIVAPLMVIHGANDPRVPIHEAEQIVQTLKSRGRTVEYLRYEDEGHGLAKLKNRLTAYPQVADFLERHLALTPADVEASGPAVPPSSLTLSTAAPVTSPTVV